MTQEELIRERDFYRAKLDESNARVKTLEFDLAELQKRDVELSKRCSELANKGNYRPKPKRFHQDDASMVELVDTLDLGSSAERRGGSTPSRRTKQGSVPL